MNKNIACIILAAGEGRRMKSEIPKVLHPICGRPMLAYVLDLARSLSLSKILVVVGNKQELFKELLDEYRAEAILQERRLGTADALKRTQGTLRNFSGNILVFYADQPLLKEKTLKELVQKHLTTGASATVLTARMENPADYGRIFRDNYAQIRAIIEAQDATDEQRRINEINTGSICFKKNDLFKAISKIKANNPKKEYYLTDAIKIMAEEGLSIESLCISDDLDQAQGINSRQDLAQAQKIMYQRILNNIMSQGVSIVDPRTTYLDYDCRIGRDTLIYPFTVIEKDVIIGKLCRIGPFCHLRPGTRIEDKAVIGNFTEIVRSRIGKETLMKHFSYLGDAVAGNKVNIGCGTVTANFDGKNKLKTVIGDNAFIGADTILRAPVKIGQKAVTGAGAVVIREVKAGEVVVGVPARPLVRCQRSS